MDQIDLLVDLHQDAVRQGPGGANATRLAIALSGLSGARNLKIADIGCGTGASTLVLARELDASIVAVDFLSAFLDRLKKAAEQEGIGDRIEVLEASMEALPFADGHFDAIWSEGAIYNMGFENGIKAWRRFLKAEGVLAVSELTWLTGKRPSELERYWAGEYPEVATASSKMAVLEANGYAPVGYFPLSGRCWLGNYYRPMQARFADFLSRNGHSESACAVVEAEEKEIALYERFSAFISYGFYIARRIAD